MASRKSVNLIVGGFLIVGVLILGYSFTSQQIAKNAEEVQIDQGVESIMVLMAKLKESPEDPEILKQVGQIFLQAEDWVRAESFLERAVKANPKDALGLSFLGLAKYNQGKFEDSVICLEKSLAINNDPDTILNLGIIYKYKLTNIDKANKLFEEVLKRDDASDFAKDTAKKEMISMVEE